MYLGYDKDGNIVTKDPFGERGESVRPLLGSKELTAEESLGAFKRAIQDKKRAMMKAANEQRAALAKKAQREAQIQAAKKTAMLNAKFLKKAQFAGSDRMYTQMGGLYGNALTPHSVSGEYLASTFKRDYGLSGIDFGRNTMGATLSVDGAKKLVREAYAEILRIETGIKNQKDALTILEKKGLKNSKTYVELKKLYDISVQRYENTPLTYQGKKYQSRKQAGNYFGLELKQAIEKKDPQGAKYVALMFAAPLVYEKLVKDKQIKAFSGYGFGSEFDQGEMGFIPLLGLAAWQVAAAVIGTAAVGGGAYALMSKDKVLDDALADSQKLIAQALKEGKPEVASQLIEREKSLLKQKEKQSEGIVEKTEKLVGVAGKGAKIALGVVALIAFWKIGMPLLQSKASEAVKPKAVPA